MTRRDSASQTRTSKWASGLDYRCRDCEGTGLIAASAPDEEKPRSQQRLARLLAGWREEAAQMDEIASEEEEDSRLEIECTERALALRDCAKELEAELAGEQPSARMSEGGPVTRPDSH